MRQARGRAQATVGTLKSGPGKHKFIFAIHFSNLPLPHHSFQGICAAALTCLLSFRNADASLSGGMSAVEKLKVIKREGWG
jgi:hypothetical protein